MKRVYSILFACIILISLIGIPEKDVNGAVNELNNRPPEGYSADAGKQAEAKEALYSRFFTKDKLQEVRIQIDDKNLQYLFDNAATKPHVMTESVTIGGETVQYAGMKTKGNYTLAHSVTDRTGSTRYSFTLDFGEYVTKENCGQKQNFYGCDKISFNNFFFDKSMLKEYVAFTIISEMGLPCPEFGLAKVYINDVYYGVYFMVESMCKAVMERYFDVEKSDLTDYLMKPEGTTFQYDELLKDNSMLWKDDEEDEIKSEEMKEIAMEWAKHLNELSRGVDFNNGVTPPDSEDYLPLLDTIIDTDEVLRYFATHSFLTQMDNMFTEHQNFGLYLNRDGRATLVPWDYDLCFGCYFPSTGETTVNYDIDVMYKNAMASYGNDTSEQNARTYANYPLFNVIYQSSVLMERYHEYMKDAAKIASLGGTTSFGKTYEPGYLFSKIQVLETELEEAASEKLGSGISYLNYTRQPGEMMKALPNIKKVIAMRAVGVYTQASGIDTYVAATGLDLSTLGNAIKGDFRNSGRLSVVSAPTGAFVTADFTASGKSIGPVLTIKEVENDSEKAQDILGDLSLENADEMRIYEMNLSKKPDGTCLLTLPLVMSFGKSDGAVHFYIGSGEGLTEVTEVSRDDNLYTFDVEEAKYIVVLGEKGTTADPVPAAASENVPSLFPIFIVCGILLLILMLVLIWITIGKHKREKAN